MFWRTIPRTGRGPILFACPINDKAGHNGELSAELIITSPRWETKSSRVLQFL
jgi:hypothetical protein